MVGQRGHDLMAVTGGGEDLRSPFAQILLCVSISSKVRRFLFWYKRCISHENLLQERKMGEGQSDFLFLLFP
jgi:hypothetical protein